jgi:hypothetical protein
MLVVQNPTDVDNAGAFSIGAKKTFAYLFNPN